MELMVAMLIGLGITFAMTSVLIASENHKRTTTSTNDAEQTGAYATMHSTRRCAVQAPRIAESAFPTDVGVLGLPPQCRRHISPAPRAFPAPFDGLPPRRHRDLESGAGAHRHRTSRDAAARTS